ncbi:hypothetical protein ATK30_6853 [Amycolatopsis echigonensis]|uniref:Uncharacterized protein n=1 Tax=Amycolatopsis echigonensis TaxID=2576905 RepID=A0A2N3WPZ5_9PSEU|nr:hypothetical protein [Amycolatopsis niigatensis]PKV95920.1 hypothetical protein ATK30_6853 [Amycolatopsis niigatensis]
MYGLATSRITVTRGTTPDQFGDAVPSGTVVYQGIADIQEISNRYFDRATQTPRTVRDLDMAVSSAADIRSGDLVHDSTFGLDYVVLDVVREFGPLTRGDTTCGLKRVG